MAKDKTLNEEVKSLKIFALNGSNFLGTIEKGEKLITITNAVPVKSSDFEGTVKNWIKAKNLNQLETFEVDGNNNTLVTKTFTEEQLMRIDIVTAKAEYALKSAVANLQNNSID